MYERALASCSTEQTAQFRRSAELDALFQAISTVRKKAGDIFLAICANTKSSSVHKDYDRFPRKTEYFSPEEASEIISKFQDNGISTAIFSEEEIAQFILNGEFRNIQKRHKMVYSGRGSGTSRSRSCKIPGLCELYKIPTCSPDPYTLALAANKFHAITLLQNFGVPTPETWLLNENGQWAGNQRTGLGTKVIGKPCYESSSIGVDNTSVADFSLDFERLIQERSHLLKQPMIVQTFIPGYEVEVPVACLNPTVSLPPVGIQIESNRLLAYGILDYDRVYSDKYDFYSFEEISPELCLSLHRTAQRAVEVLMLQGLCRIDFRILPDGTSFVTDVNALPHLTRHGSCAFAVESLGLSYSDLLCMIAAFGLQFEG